MKALDTTPEDVNLTVTVATTLPSAYFGFGTNIIKSVGTTARVFDMDWLYAEHDPTGR